MKAAVVPPKFPLEQKAENTPGLYVCKLLKIKVDLTGIEPVTS